MFIIVVATSAFFLSIGLKFLHFYNYHLISINLIACNHRRNFNACPTILIPAISPNLSLLCPRYQINDEWTIAEKLQAMIDTHYRLWIINTSRFFKNSVRITHSTNMMTTTYMYTHQFIIHCETKGQRKSDQLTCG